MSEIEIDELTLHYERAGTGERLLFISGTGGDLRNKPSVFDGPLGARFDLLAYDQRGLGQSSVPDGPYTMADYADDAGALLDEVGWERCLVMGVSFGGMVAQEVAIRHGSRVSRLVLACTSSGGAGGASIPFTELERLDGLARVARQIEIMDTRWDGERRETHRDEWELMVAGMSAYLRANEGASERVRGSTLQLQARSHHDTWDRLGEISCPTLVCGGRFDGIAPPANSEHLAERIPGAELALFDGGHQFLWQDPAAYKRVMEFLSGATE